MAPDRMASLRRYPDPKLEDAMLLEWNASKMKDVRE